MFHGKCKCVYSKCREKKREHCTQHVLVKAVLEVYITRVFHGMRPLLKSIHQTGISRPATVTLKYTSNDVVFQIYAIDTYYESVKLTVLLKERSGVKIYVGDTYLQNVKKDRATKRTMWS